MPGEHDEIDVAAAELALGLLDGAERAAALRRVLASPDFAAEVAGWRESFAELYVDAPEVVPPEGFFARIEAALDRPTPRVSRIWPIATAASAIAAACAIALLMLRPVIERPVPVPVATTAPVPLVAAITPPEGAALVAVYDRDSAALRITGADLAPPERSAELWAIGGDGVPHALGLLEGKGTVLVIATDDRGRLTAGATLAVSIEPIGGSPTGKPTGPVVATGALELI